MIPWEGARDGSNRHLGGYSIIIAVLVGIVSAGPIEATDAIKVGAVMATKGIIKEIYLSVNDALQDCFAVANEEGGINGKKLNTLLKKPITRMWTSVRRLSINSGVRNTP